MSVPESNPLFRGSRSQDILNYFLSRLQAGDLSSEEALAIMSAVHADLGRGSPVDPRIYQSYSTAMKSLEQAMPDVYDYVVTTWSREKKTEISDRDQPDNEFNEIDNIGESMSKSHEAGSNIGSPDLGISDAEEKDDAGDSAEAEGVDEEKAHPDEEVETENDESNKNEIAEETETAENPEKDDEEQEGKEDLNEENTDGSVEEIETEDSTDEEKDVANENTGNEEIESESTEEPEKEEMTDEVGSGSEKGEGGGEGESEEGEVAEQEETEWPEIEQLSPGESSEGFDGDENPIPPED
jgi:hypothetical protein